MISVHCKKYEYNLPVVKKIQNLIAEKYEKLFFAVIVHGSVGTNEVIPYSDFDGLLIVKDKYKKSILLKKFIKKSMKLIYQFDPLQHHGWFFIYESQLQNYPQTYFPYELFEFAKVIYPGNDIEMSIILKNSYDYSIPFEKISQNIIHKIEINRPKNLYNLKGFLSQFMLLPSLYIQKLEMKGIFKKRSFIVIKDKIPRDNLEVLNSVSKIRNEWSYKINFIQKWFLMRQNRYLRRILIPLFSPRIPEELEKLMEKNIYKKMKIFTEKLKAYHAFI